MEYILMIILLFLINAKLKDVNYNIKIVDGSLMPYVRNGNLILAGHNGSAYISFFKNLYKLDINDSVYVYFDGIKYEYKINMNCLIGLFRNKMIEIAIEKDDEIRKNLYLTLINKLQRYLVPIKPNRTFKRRRVYTDNKYTTNLRRNC